MSNKLEIYPSDIEAEKVVIGTLMSYRDTLHEVDEILKPEVFYDPFHKRIYSAIKAIDERGLQPDMLTVFNDLRKTDDNADAYKLSLIAECRTTDLYQYAAIVHDKYIRRNLIDIADRLRNMSFDEANDIVDIQADAEERIKSVFSESGNDVFTIDEAIQCVRDQIEKNHSNQVVQTGTPTGFYKFDQKSGGLQKSDLIIIAADTSQGKTSMSVSMALNAALSGNSIAFYSMEMKKEQIAARMMSIQSGVPANQILYSRLDTGQFDMIERGLGTLYNRKIFFDDRSTSNIDTIISSIRKLKKKYGIDGAIVDYLQILNVNMKGASPEQQMGNVARRLKNLAKELDIWIMALSQLSRDNINPVPTLNRLRDSGQIGEAADVVMLIYRPEIYNKYYPEPFKTANTSGTAMIDVAKGRNIGLLKFLVGFNKNTTKFYDISDNEYMNFKQDEEDRPF